MKKEDIIELTTDELKLRLEEEKSMYSKLKLNHAISPIDGRYTNATKDLSPYFSEFGLIHYRVKVEIEYFIAICELPLKRLIPAQSQPTASGAI